VLAGKACTAKARLALADPRTGTAQGHHCSQQISEVIEYARIWISINPDIAEKDSDHTEENQKAMNDAHPESGWIQIIG